MGALVLLPVAAWLSPLALRRVDFFKVRRVELVGVRYLAPETVLEALKLEPDRNLFDDNGPPERRAGAIPGVVRANVRRRLPATLRVELVERVPVAFVPGDSGLVPLDEEARVLPYDPAESGLDLPIVPLIEPAVVRALGVVRLADSALYQEVVAARRGGRNTIILELEQQQVLLQEIPDVGDIRSVEAVRRHLVANGRPFDQLDARFAGWVIVRRGGA